MKPKGLLIAVVLLAVLGGVVWWSNKKQSVAGKEFMEAATKLVSIPEDQFQEIKIKKLTGEVQDLRRENGKWRLTQPNQFRADQDTVGLMVNALTNVVIDKVIEEKAADLQPYGLHIPTLDITVVKKDGKSDELLIGDDAPTGVGTYAKRADDSRVVTISAYIKPSIDKTANDLRDKHLLTFDSDKLTRVELDAKGASIEFGKNNQNEWQILKPGPLRADGSQVDTLIEKLKDSQMDLSGAAEDFAKKFAAAAQVATVVVSDANGNQKLEIRTDKDKNFYARSSAVEGIYKMNPVVAGWFDKSLDDFRNKKLFDFGFSDPGKVELKTATYTKSGDKWLAGSKTMDNTSLQNLIDKLRDLSATKFAEKGGGVPVFEAKVTSNSGKRVETVAITKQGAQYFAQREGEPSIYEMDSKAVDDLQKAASDVKEAAPAQPNKK